MKVSVIKIGITSFIALWLTGCSMPKEIEQNEQFTQQVIETPHLIHNVEVPSLQGQAPYTVHYVSSDNSPTPRPTVVFVHGTPGGWESFSRYFLQPDLLKEFRLISIDRPGWGKSTYPDKQFPTHLERQSELLGPTLKHIWQHNGHQKIILVGHSLGGSLVPLLAADYPEYTRGVVILAGDVNPKLAQARWYNTLLNWIPDALIPDEWAHSNMEVLALSESLSQVQQRLAQLHTPITILQGTADELVDPDNAKIAKQLFQHSQLKVEWIPGAGHIIHLQHIDLVKAAIERMNQRS